jgi:hypothetical protein
MIVGSGLIASAMSDRPGVIQYAAGVSNSGCTDPEEFKRDKGRLWSVMKRDGLFVYFSTCSSADSPYVAHKRACETMVMERGDYLICRLPIVAGTTTNPHTLLNLLRDRITRSEAFDLWPAARRNVIDVIDIRTIVQWLIGNARNETVNVAAPMDYSMREIVAAFEQLIGKPARVRIHEGGTAETLDVSRIADVPIHWGDSYLQDVLWKRYR